LANRLTQKQLMDLARRGAPARLAELRQEMAVIQTLFGGRTGSSRTGATSEPRARRQTSWSASQRKAVSVRMKKYWAAKRKAS
jgi:hypothetical protein